MPLVACIMALVNLLPAPATEGECHSVALQLYSGYIVEGT